MREERGGFPAFPLRHSPSILCASAFNRDVQYALSLASCSPCHAGAAFAARPAFRWRQLCALARVTASEFGRPAAGMAEAVALLKA